MGLDTERTLLYLPASLNHIGGDNIVIADATTSEPQNGR